MILRKWNYKKRKYEKFNSPVEFPILVLPLEAKGKKFVVIGCYVFCTDEIQYVVLQKCYDDWGGIKVFLKNGEYFQIRIAPKEYRALPDLLNKF